MEWVALALGIASLIGGIVTGIKGMKKEEETQEYNKELNQTVMDREDNAWQRAVKDRSQAGLSIAGLTQGSGAGGTVSQLQAPQSMAQMSNLFQNFSSQSFGLAMSAYDNRKARELQKENFLEELELKKEELKNSKLNSQYQRLMLLNEISRANSQEAREAAIYTHNMKIAKGEEKNPLSRVYGSQPSELERLVQALVNNRESLKEKAGDLLFGESIPEPEEKDIYNAAKSATQKGNGKHILTTDLIKQHIGPDGLKLWEEGELSKYTEPVKVVKEGNDHYLITDTNKRQHKIRISKADYEFWINQLN